eukprot:TRINITY_DN1397_c3_g1_i1.p1 TRINITY_DN1397_c3_g1~~TRINITY_DN1397_c3_g1_i1.p1  ORF type:complete len:470 (+),score=124.13 TRINITY_DN1397_c3_g1_i1:26-1411(+)
MVCLSDVGLLIGRRDVPRAADDADAVRILEAHLQVLEDTVVACVAGVNRKEAEMWLVGSLGKQRVEEPLKSEAFLEVLQGGDEAAVSRLMVPVLTCMAGCAAGRALLGVVLPDDRSWEEPLLASDANMRTWFPPLYLKDNKVIAARGSAPLRDFIFAERSDLWSSVQWMDGREGHPPVLTVSRSSLQLELDMYATAKVLKKQLIASTHWTAALSTGAVIDVDRAFFVRHFASLFSDDVSFRKKLLVLVQRFLKATDWQTLVTDVAAQWGEGGVTAVCRHVAFKEGMWSTYNELLLYTAVCDKLLLALNMMKTDIREKLLDIIKEHSTQVSALDDFCAFTILRRSCRPCTVMLLLLRSAFVAACLPPHDVSAVLAEEGLSAEAQYQDTALCNDEDPMAQYIEAERRSEQTKRKHRSHKQSKRQKTSHRTHPVAWTLSGNATVSCHDLPIFVATKFKEHWQLD